MCCIVSQALRNKSAIVRCQLTSLLTHAQLKTQDKRVFEGTTSTNVCCHSDDLVLFLFFQDGVSVSTRIITSQQQSDASSPALPTMPDQEHRARKSSSKLPLSSLNGACAPPACFSEMAFSLSATLKTKSNTARSPTLLVPNQEHRAREPFSKNLALSISVRCCRTDLVHLLLQDGLLVGHTKNQVSHSPMPDHRPCLCPTRNTGQESPSERN